MKRSSGRSFFDVRSLARSWMSTAVLKVGFFHSHCRIGQCFSLYSHSPFYFLFSWDLGVASFLPSGVVTI